MGNICTYTNVINKKINPVSIEINKQVLAYADTAKYLGRTFDCNGRGMARKKETN